MITKYNIQELIKIKINFGQTIALACTLSLALALVAVVAVQIAAGSPDPNVILSETATHITGACNASHVMLTVHGLGVQKSVDAILVIDVSTSMSYSPPTPTSLDFAKQAANNFVDQILGQNPSSKVGLVTYSTTATLVRALTNNSANLHSSINGLTASGNTNIDAGFYTASQQFAGPNCNRTQVIILLTDGVANLYGHTATPTSCDTWPTAHTTCTNTAMATGKAAWSKATVFTVGLFGYLHASYPQCEGVAVDTLNQSQNGGYYQTYDGSELSQIYSHIASGLAPAARNGVITDNVSNAFSIIPGSIKLSPSNRGSITTSGNNITWSFSYLSSEDFTLQYNVSCKSGTCGVPAVNSVASLYYQKSDCTYNTLDFPNPAAVCVCIDPTITAPSSLQSSSTGNTASTGAGDSYLWTITNGAITSASNTQSITFTAGSSGITTLNVVVSKDDCSRTSTQSIPILYFTKQVNKTDAEAGDYLKYDLYPSYNGTVLLANAVVKDVIPYNTSIVGSANASGTYYPGNKTVVWSLGSNTQGATGKTTASYPQYVKAVATNDTWLNRASTTSNYGTDTKLRLRAQGGTNERRAILYFAMPTLPTGSTYVSGKLEVYVIDPTSNPSTINIYELMRSWCLQQNGLCTACLIVEGLLNGTSPGYGATWNCYNYRSGSSPCNWGTAGAKSTSSDYINPPSLGSFSGNSADLKTTDISSIVQSWISTPANNHGLLLASNNNGYIATIGSRENSVSSQRPYINISYTIPVKTNVSISAMPLLNCKQSLIYVNMTVNSSLGITINPPASLTVTGTNGATATLMSGPTPTGPVTILANKNYYFNYVYSAKPGSSPGTLKFTGKPTVVPSYALYSDATSNTVLITPALSYIVRIDPATSPTVPSIWNNATIYDSNVFPGGALSNTTVTNLNWHASISASKTVNLTQGPPSTKLNFTLKIDNTGRVTMNPVKVVDTLPYGLAYVSSNGSCTVAGNTITWTNIGPIGAGQSKSLYLVAHINGSAYGVLTNKLNVTATSPDHRKYYSNTTGAATALHASITASKTVNLSQGAPSTKINFTLRVNNTGEVTMDPVKVVDTLPYGLNYISSNGSSAVAGNVITWNNIGPINAGQSKSLYLVAHINGSAYGVLTNKLNATATSPTGLKYYANTTRDVTAQHASITASKTANLSQGAPSTAVNFTINVSNTGQVTLNPVSVVDTLPTGLDYVSSNGTHIGSTVTWSNIGPMNAGQMKSLFLVAHINGLAYGPLNNTVNVTGTPPTGDQVTANASRIVTAKRASILINKTSNVSSVVVGNRVNFTINVTNAGEVALNPTNVVDTLPYGMFYISSNGTAIGNVVTWNNIGPLSVGQSKNLYLVAQLNGSVIGPLYNYVNVTGTPPTGNPVTNESTREVTALANVPSITIIKDADPTEVVYLNNITFTIEVANSGGSVLSPVMVVDILPTGLTYVSDDRGGSVVGKTITWNNVGPLAVGATTVIHLVAFVDGDKFGSLVNHVNATGKPALGNNVTDSAVAVVEALSHPNISIIKTATPKTVGPGGNVTFIINTTNIGDVPLSTVKVVDILPISMVYVSDNRSGTVSYNMITWNNVGPLDVNQSTYISLNTTVTL